MIRALGRIASLASIGVAVACGGSLSEKAVDVPCIAPHPGVVTLSMPLSPALPACAIGDVETCTARCNGGSVESCHTLAEMYATGNRVQRDDMKALRLWRKLCRWGDKPACDDNDAFAAHERKGVENCRSGSLVECAAACDLGIASSCRTLADYYLSGKRVTMDVDKAEALLGRGCDVGDQESCLSLGRLYDRHADTSSKYELSRATACFQHVCDDLSLDGCDALEHDHPDLAARGFAAICAEGSSEACERIVSLSDDKKLPSAQRPLLVAALRTLCRADAKDEACGRLKDLGESATP